MPMRRIMLVLLAGLPLTAWSAAGSAAEPPLKVVASFSILGDMVQEIGGDHVDLTTLVGPDGDAHVYEPNPSDAKAIAAARLLVINGLGFESWLPRLADASSFTGETITASSGITPRIFEEAGHDHDDAEEHGVNDPHAWQSLTNGVIYARNIGAALAKADPDHAADYEKATADYVARLRALDAAIKARLAAIPTNRRKIVTSHDAFGYFGDAYGIQFIAPVGTSTEAEASAADVAKIIDQIRDENITSVFMENITNTKLIDQIVNETGARVGGSLYSDALSGTEGPASSYEKMFNWNVSQLMEAMAGS
jgi:zinc/manganese transport system substrate-binding protein